MGGVYSVGAPKTQILAINRGGGVWYERHSILSSEIVMVHWEGYTSAKVIIGLWG